jgi:hypothetical protein
VVDEEFPLVWVLLVIDPKFAAGYEVEVAMLAEVVEVNVLLGAHVRAIHQPDPNLAALAEFLDIGRLALAGHTVQPSRCRM